MLSLPYGFDTAETWVKIVKIFLIIAGVYLAMIVGLLLKGQFVGGIVALVFGLALSRMIRRVPLSIGTGARGRLTATEVTTQAVKVWRYRLHVPVGRFPVSNFSEVAVTERVVVTRPPNASASYGNVGSVCLIGRNGAPDIEIFVGGIDAANSFANELGAALKLPLHTLAAPGTTIARVSL